MLEQLLARYSGLTHSLGLSNRKRRRRAGWAPEALEIRTVPAAVIDLAGAWTFNGQAVSIQQNGSQLLFINERGGQSTGEFFGDNTQIRAFNWSGLTGTISSDGNTIFWANNSVWSRDTAATPVLAGNWTFNGQPTSIAQAGTTLTFTNEVGQQSSGTFISNTQVQATDWAGLTGTLSNNNTRITWANGAVWNKSDGGVINPPDISGAYLTNNLSASITQNGTSLVFINENGQSTPGTFLSQTQVQANGWGITGTISSGEILWSNGSVWTRNNGSFTPPDISGVYVFNGLNTRVEQNGNLLTFTNENGNVSGGSFISATQVRASNWGITGTLVGNEIRWSNGATWLKGSADAPVNLVGNWLTNGRLARIEVGNGGQNLRLVNENGGQSTGVFTSASQLVATEWGNLVGTISNNATVISWGNGTVWTRTS